MTSKTLARAGTLGRLVVLEARGLGARPDGVSVSTALTLTPNRGCTTRKNRRISTIPAEHFDGRLGSVSTVDTGLRRSKSVGLAAVPGASVSGPPPPTPARHLRWGPVVRVRLRPHLRVSSSLPSPRGSGSTGQGLCVLHEGPTYPQYPRPSSSRTPLSCSASRRRRKPPQ